MFIKPFKPKSNVQLKASERKKLRPQIQQNFPNLTENDLNNLLPNKATITQIKITTYGNVLTCIYAADKRPLFFEDERNILIPTVYALWITPNMIPFFTTHPNVLPKLANGADLMLPGVIPQGLGLGAYGNYKKDQIVAINLTSNKSAVAVGRLSRSSNDLYMSGGHGPCVKVLHVFGDKLWGLEPTVALQIPDVGALIELPKDDDFPELGQTMKRPNKQQKEERIEQIEETAEKLVEPFSEIELDNENDNVIESIIENVGNTNEPNMDDILKQAFLTCLKYDGRKLILPLLTSNFYRVHILPVAIKQIDLKQTSYKKLSKFLNQMSEEGFIVVREETKGVEKLISIDFEHPELINFIPDTTNSVEKSDTNKPQLFHVAMTELYTITDETIGLFSKLNFKKGDGIPSNQVKKLLKEYVSKNKLPYLNNNTKIIQLDKTLADICNNNSCLLDDLYQNVLSKMKHTFEMRGKNEVTCNKPIIQLSLATRSGNKKVTLVSNLEAYGIIITEFAKSCKLGAAASTTIIKTPCQKHEQLQIQGNQIRFIYNLLTETYKIPPKQIIGLDLAKKEKKKK